MSSNSSALSKKVHVACTSFISHSLFLDFAHVCIAHAAVPKQSNNKEKNENCSKSQDAPRVFFSFLSPSSKQKIPSKRFVINEEKYQKCFKSSENKCK
jgi:hypothetical protein